MNERSELTGLLESGLHELGIGIEAEQSEQFMAYMDMLKEWNTKMNLTAIEDEREIIIKHFIDSLTILPYIERGNKSLIDVGTGAGFPGIPLKIMNKSLDITLLDSLEKRTKFLNEAIKALGLKGITAVHGRAEDFGAGSHLRENCDYAAARAVAALPVLLEYCLPFVRTGGIFIAMKGSSTEEVECSYGALKLLGGEIEDVKTLILPFTDIKRNIIIVKKLRQTPTKYPRKAGKPSKNPLK
jgi:16S rRNA (guanine527-N7)-methyltransferase